MNSTTSSTTPAMITPGLVSSAPSSTHTPTPKQRQKQRRVTTTATATLFKSHHPHPERHNDHPLMLHRHHRDVTYYAHCAAGGVVASSVRWIVTPLEVLKSYQQIGGILPRESTGGSSSFRTSSSSSSSSLRGAGTGILGGLRYIYAQEGVRGLYKGLGATAAAYAVQTGTKLSLYEYLRDAWSISSHDNLNNSCSSLSSLSIQQEEAVGIRGSNHTRSSSSWITLSAAFCAEVTATILMCPFEQQRVQIQTTAQQPQMMSRYRFRPHPWSGLGPLLARQVPGTMINLYTFENSVRFIYQHLLDPYYDYYLYDKEDKKYSRRQQLSVTLVAGYMAGMACAIVSHPADSLLSLRMRHPHMSVRALVQQRGLMSLCTRGLAPRVVTLGTIIGGQWYLYDCFKTCVGLGTSGR